MTTKHIPASACRLMAVAEIGDNGDGATTAPIRILARTGNPVEVSELDAPLIHDFSGMQVKSRIAIDWSHDGNLPLGYCNHFETDTGNLVCSGALVSVNPNSKTEEVIQQYRSGIPMEASLDWRGPAEIQRLGEGQSEVVNGRAITGPMYVVRRWLMRGVALCICGKDPGTYAQFSAGDTVEMTVVPYRSGQKSIGDQTMSAQSAEADVAVEIVEDKAVETEKVVETEETEKSVETEEAVVETPAMEGGKPVEVVVQKEVQKESQTLSEGARFLQAFGNQGGVWFAQGKSYDEATRLFIRHLSAENVELKARLQSARGAEAPVSFSESTTSDAQRELSEAAKQMTEKGISPAVAQLAAAMKLHRKKAK